MDTLALDRTFIANTYSRFPLEIAGGNGSVLYDAHGNEYLDLCGGIAVNVFGMNDAPWKQAVEAQLNRFSHCSNYYYSAPAAHLAQLLCARTGMQKVFFSNSGAEANECAIKTARKWAAREKGTDYYTIITLKNSFHGRTLATVAATAQESFHRDFLPLMPGFAEVAVGDVAALECTAREKKCAAVLFECVQGEGGVLPIGQEFADALARVCAEQNLLLIADEVQLGTGRSGALYGYMNYGLSPDLVSTAKGLGGGLPLGATLFGTRVADVLIPGDHGSTFGGNPVCCAGAISVLERIDEPLLRGVRERSEYICRELRGAKGVQSISGMGLMLGIQATCPGRVLAERLLRQGVLVATAKQKIRLLPALNIPMEQLITAVQIIKDCAAD